RGHGAGAGDRVGRRRHARPSGGRRADGPCQRGAGRFDLPLRRILDRGSEGAYGPRRDRHAGGRMTGFTLSDLDRIVAERAAATPQESYTAKLIAGGPARAAKKLGEEAVEAA